MIRSALVLLLFAGISVQTFAAETPSPHVWKYKPEMLRQLVKEIPGVLKSQDPKTGRFGTGIWIVTDQNRMWSLAVAWATKSPDNPYYHSPELLDAIMAAGDALIADQDATGMWEFRKKDGSTWGPIYMPWTYSRWIRSYAIIKDAMPPARRDKWVKALTLGFTGISKGELDEVQNIPTHDAMALYCAGKALDHPDWCEQAKAFMKEVVAKQDPGGFWSENFGPVVGYNFVYMDAIGAYYGMSHDKTVLPALERGARYHANFTYPDGTAVETVDERQVYHNTVVFPNVGFTFSPEGRGYLKAQWERLRKEGKTPSADGLASLIYYGEEGTTLPTPGELPSHHFVLGHNDAVVHRQGPWFVCISSYHTAIPTSRWIQDRQNFVSLFHDGKGLILGGGNTKLQPYWSTFCVGNPALFKHTPGDENPNFSPPPGVWPVPDDATLDPVALKLSLQYHTVKCAVAVDLPSPTRARLVYTVDPATLTLPIIANVTLLPKKKTEWFVANGEKGKLDDTRPFEFTSGKAGPWFSYSGYRISIPKGATLRWPVYGHDPYKKAGQGSFNYARIVLTLPFSKTVTRQEVTVEVPPDMTKP